VAQKLLPEAAPQFHVGGSNRKDRNGRNVFEGGFLGLDNIGSLRSQRAAADRWLSGTGRRHRVDGPLLPEHAGNRRRAVNERSGLRRHGPQFVEHFLWIASAMSHLGGGSGMWDEEDGFYYDVLCLPNGQSQRLKVRSMVGLLPLCAATVFDGGMLTKYPEIAERLKWFITTRPEPAGRDS